MFNNKVTFSTEVEFRGVFPPPIPASKAIPDYYKNIKPQSDPNDVTSSTVKRCIPFLEAMTAGYIIPMWSDVRVIANNEQIKLDFPTLYPYPTSLENHPIVQMPDHPLVKQPYGTILLKWMNPWVIETPPGYSCLFTSPLNHFENRFKIIDGVVDTDKYVSNVNFPFLWTAGDGEYIIKRGTPLVHVIPFKREQLSMQIADTDKHRKSAAVATIGTYLYNGYRKAFWHRQQKDADK